MNFERPQVIVVGGGVTGIATALNLARKDIRTCLIEKETEPGKHQSSRNSGVLHVPYNFEPGSKKAEICLIGNRAIRAYSEENHIPVHEGGILVVGRNEAEFARLEELRDNGTKAGAQVELLNRRELLKIEPNAIGEAALSAPEGATIDSEVFVNVLAREAAGAGVDFRYGERVASICETENSVTVVTDKGDEIEGDVSITTGGLYADVLAGKLAEDYRVIPFRGFYAQLASDKRHMVNSNIYQPSSKKHAFLGIHFTKLPNGRVIVGPGAMPALGREGYSLTSFKGGKLWETLSYSGFWHLMADPDTRKLMGRELKKSLFIRSIAQEAMEVVSGLKPEDFEPYSRAGNRAQLVDRKGNLVNQTVILKSKRTAHALGINSPGFTCTFPNGLELAGIAMELLNQN